MPHCVTSTSESADASTLTRRKYSAHLTPRGVISLGCIVLQSTKPAVVGCRLPPAEDQEQQLQAQLGRPARCTLPLDEWRGNYGWYQAGYDALSPGPRNGLERRHKILYMVHGCQVEKLSGRWTGLRATADDEWRGSTLSR